MRKKTINRKTKETDISLTLNLDGSGKSEISTGIAFFDHMLSSFSKHSTIDLELRAVGDIDVDFHHTIEDVGIVLGMAFDEAIGDKKGIERFGEAIVPLDESLCRAVVDLSGRAFLHCNLTFERGDDGSGINPYLFEEFFLAFVNNARINLHLDKIRGKNSHHILEASFKALARAVKKAITVNGDGIPSTKGVI